MNTQNLFDPESRGSKLDHALVQREVITGNLEGGFFLMIGRKPGSLAVRAARAPVTVEASAASAVVG